MVAKENPEVIEGRQRLIAVDVLDSDEADDDASIVHDDYNLDEEDGIGLVGAGITEEEGDMQKALKSSSISSYILKPSHLLTQGFGENMTSKDKLFENFFNFGERAEWREGIRVFSSYLDVDITKDQYRLLNTTPLECTTGYIMDNAVGERALNRMPQIRLNFIACLICSIHSDGLKIEH